MCGIAGYYSSSIFNKQDLQAMTQTLSHRGPDAEGWFTDEVCGLGHRRLSILDLSENANQPMYSHNKRYVMVFNGEVYNYQDIARKYDLVLSTTSDSEVILEGFVKLGAAIVHELNGMFVFVIYDIFQQELFIFRDRVGIKPLFYYWDGQNFAFASELKSLVNFPQIHKKIDVHAIGHFLSVGYIPAPQTIYENIFKMPAASMCKLTQRGLEQTPYWTMTPSAQGSVLENEQQAKTELHELLKSAVKYQLISDVPLGVFLSGGIDSSLVTALAVSQSATRVNTFSIGFKEQKFNETQFSGGVAKHLGTQHHEFIVSVKEARDLVETMLDVYDEPYADSSAIPTMIVSALARKHVTVALGGDGADELFFGYGMYKWASRLATPGIGILKDPLSIVLKQRSKSKYQKASRMLDFEDKQHLAHHIFSQEQGFFTQKEVKELLNVDVQPFCTKNIAAKSGSRSLTAMEVQSLFDLNFYLPDDLLVKVDRASMQYGLEARVPFLDHRVVEFALNLSPHLKYKNGVSKYILKEILYEYLPAEMFNRPKQGFSIPLHEWLRQDLQYLIHDYLDEKVVKQYAIVDNAMVQQIKLQFLEGNDFVYNRLWLLIVLHRWLVKNVN
ncbi:asparagine synthase (glutamine-hydrolyzing) [Rhodocytophaga aerolata]|uniref:asparagine synthase (glutamine-hydrolyzing) n=1 Tax=Rhodocytophaga aerolata TaxID=455078 RepID=A0ABT8RCA3_9BACT|nr:asparagine synthase (glutamine-hydrolyzing) [Rhodocytophaga aerolata]MDO1448853.1 asparagine synthase (glutamine-hydrolyzing) [Rhodocytophaga aerolata]